MQDFNLRSAEKRRFALTNLNGSKAKFRHHNDGLTSSLRKMRYLIIEALKERNFNVKGIEVDFWHMGSGKQHFIEVYSVKFSGIKFYPHIEFRSNYSCLVKGMRMNIHEDGSGGLEMYCGKNWRKHQKEFYCHRHHRKMNNLSRIVLNYEIRDRVKFVATSDCDREYYPEGNEPKTISLARIEKNIFDKAEMLLNYINSFPVTGYNPNIFSEPNPVMFTNYNLRGIELRTFIKEETLERIMKPQDKTETYGLSANSWRLLSLNINPPKHPLSDYMNEGFIYCDMKQRGSDKFDSNHEPEYQNYFEVSVVPKKMDMVFVFDQAIFNDTKAKWFDENPKEFQMPMELVNNLLIEKAKSLIHINDYKGNYKKPVVAICRELASDEIYISMGQIKAGHDKIEAVQKKYRK